jgi:hypothetical protein
MSRSRWRRSAPSRRGGRAGQATRMAPWPASAGAGTRRGRPKAAVDGWMTARATLDHGGGTDGGGGKGVERRRSASTAGGGAQAVCSDRLAHARWDALPGPAARGRAGAGAHRALPQARRRAARSEGLARSRPAPGALRPGPDPAGRGQASQGGQRHRDAALVVAGPMGTGLRRMYGRTLPGASAHSAATGGAGPGRRLARAAALPSGPSDADRAAFRSGADPSAPHHTGGLPTRLTRASPSPYSRGRCRPDDSPVVRAPPSPHRDSGPCTSL